MIASISGIRGRLNDDLFPEEIVRLTTNFATLTSSNEFLIGRDTRPTGPVIERLVLGTLLGVGGTVSNYGVISTPAIFRESRRTRTLSVMITASHNEPDWNGLKFTIDGRGITHEELRKVLARSRSPPSGILAGRVVERVSPSYNEEVVQMAGGEGTCQGVRIVIDMGGGSAINHAPAIFNRLGCKLETLGGTPGVFGRTIDPTNDDLTTLSRTVQKGERGIGFAFDCDGDRLVVVGPDGEKRSGDFMLTLALSEILPNLSERSVVVSADTTQAVDEVVTKLGGKVYRSRVGEANVITLMREKGVELGGEGSSGGLIDGRFNHCRDSMIAAVTIVKAFKRKGSKIFDQVKSYNQVRLKLEMERKKSQIAIKRLLKEHPEAEKLDGFKLFLSPRSWVLVRPSGTEDIIRISAEAQTASEAREVADSFMKAVKRLAGHHG